jgi:phage tail-like protein
MATPLFQTNAPRNDPYRTFKFQLLINGIAVAGLNKMGALEKTIETVKWRNTDDPIHKRVMSGGASYEAVTLEQGLTLDPDFEKWANLTNNIEGDAVLTLKNFRKDIIINILNLQGQLAISYKLYRAWVSEFQSLPDLDAGIMNAVGIQSMTLQHEGWERDTSVII